MRIAQHLAAAIVAAAALIPLSQANAAPQKKAAVRTDWSKVVAATPEGGFRIGNPAAKVKLVEYASLTCPHCRNFAQTAVTPLLANYVRPGKVSYEFRNFVLNGVDASVSLVARCGGARSFFPIIEDLYAAQPTWVARVTGLSDAQKQEMTALSDSQRLARMAEVTGVLTVAARHGVGSAAAKRCLADPAGLTRLAKMAEAANALGVRGTPTFFINGEAHRLDDWVTLEPLLRKAGG